MLMIEHRLIERMLGVINRELEHIRETGKVDPLFIDTVVDFIEIYADRTHHGKEEDIFFRELSKKEMSGPDQQLMEELVDDHVYGRRITGELTDANAQYRNGEKSALAVITENLGVLTDFYPRHIEKEDKVFFPASRNYFTEEEDRALVEEFLEFDRKMIHEKYRGVIERWDK
ncbi:MAG: hemerythrin domain-containing protein [Desulfobulbaceae bacterium]|nr:hemerythrin domain-containing protein [Desulfobulbaceae bacterium]